MNHACVINSLLVAEWIIKLSPHVDHDSVAKSQFEIVLSLDSLSKYLCVRLDGIHTQEAQNRCRVVKVVMRLQNIGRGKFLSTYATDKQFPTTCT